MGKSLIESHCQMINYSVNKFKLFDQIANRRSQSHFSFNLLIININLASDLKSFNFRFKLDTFCSVIFHNIKNNVIHVESVITVSYCNTVLHATMFTRNSSRCRMPLPD